MTTFVYISTWMWSGHINRILVHCLCRILCARKDRFRKYSADVVSFRDDSNIFYGALSFILLIIGLTMEQLHASRLRYTAASWKAFRRKPLLCNVKPLKHRTILSDLQQKVRRCTIAIHIVYLKTSMTLKQLDWDPTRASGQVLRWWLLR